MDLPVDSLFLTPHVLVQYDCVECLSSSQDFFICTVLKDLIALLLKYGCRPLYVVPIREDWRQQNKILEQRKYFDMQTMASFQGLFYVSLMIKLYTNFCFLKKKYI